MNYTNTTRESRIIMTTIKETVEKRLMFHGQNPDTDITASLIDTLENREAQIQADLLRTAEDWGLDEEQVLAVLHTCFGHPGAYDVAPTFDTVMARIGILTAALGEQVEILSAMNADVVYVPKFTLATPVEG